MPTSYIECLEYNYAGLCVNHWPRWLRCSLCWLLFG